MLIHMLKPKLESLHRTHERQRLRETIPNALHEGVGRDACGVIGTIRKTGFPSHGNVKRALESLTQMAHRSGEVRGEGDGCGIQTDIPKKLWKAWLTEAGIQASTVDETGFFVAHLFIPVNVNPRDVLDHIRANTMKFGSLCALGGFTPYPVMSAMTYFPDDFNPKPLAVAAE